MKTGATIVKESWFDKQALLYWDIKFGVPVVKYGDGTKTMFGPSVRDLFDDDFYIK